MGRRGYNPFRGFVDVTSEMNRMRELGSHGYETTHEGRERTHASAWVPNADVFARGEDLIIRLELSGVSREEIDLSLHDNVLTVSGERRSELDDDTSFYVHERFYGAFRRSMTLPTGMDESRISAYSENGVLEITVRGGATAEPRRIQVGERPA